MYLVIGLYGTGLAARLVFGMMAGNFEYHTGWDMLAELLFWPIFCAIYLVRAFVRRIGAAFTD